MIRISIDTADTLRRRTHNDRTREIARKGLLVPSDPAAIRRYLDEETIAWMTDRLGMTPVQTDEGTEWRRTLSQEERADKIARKFGCEINGSGNRTAVQVRPVAQRGWPQDARAVEECLAELEACDISTRGWLR